MPTSAILTFSSRRVEPIRDIDEAGTLVVNLKASTTYAAGTILGEVTATPGTYGAYATGNVDGTQNATLILMYDSVTDASGNITLGAGPAGTSEWSQTMKGAACWTSGRFSCADLVGIDAGAVTKLGRLLRGTTSSGELVVNGA